ncbi:MAG: hypothetical protein HOB18_10405 [Nitrospina sp.]|nr:hypothetical protein [Nitrospina sp.]
MKWFAGILIVAVMTAHLILGRNMNMHEQQFGYEKKLPTMSYEGTINGKYFFKMALTREDNILSGTLVNTYKTENEVYGTIDDEDSFVLTEYEDGQKAGVLEGRIMQGGELKGTWSTSDGKKWFPFFLIKAAH